MCSSLLIFFYLIIKNEIFQQSLQSNEVHEKQVEELHAQTRGLEKAIEEY